MFRILQLLSLVCMVGLLFGCGSRKVDNSDYMQARYRQNYVDAMHLEDADREEKELGEGGQGFTVSPVRGRQVVSRAQSAIGTPYVPGGRNPGGFDCSGLVQWAYQSVGVKLPRTAREQSQVGKRITSVENMRAGDIVAFRHPRRGYHTGIYVGDGKFVHSPRRRTRVRINSLSDPYYSETFLGARRLPGDATKMNLVAQAEERLRQYDGERRAREVKKASRSRVSKEKARTQVKKKASGSRVSKDKGRSRATKSKARSSTRKDASRSRADKTKARSQAGKKASGSHAGKTKAKSQADKKKAQASKKTSSSTSRKKTGSRGKSKDARKP